MTTSEAPRLAQRYGCDELHLFDVLVLGTGVAGLSVALSAARSKPNLLVGVLTKTQVRSGSSPWAQGGIAAAIGA